MWNRRSGSPVPQKKGCRRSGLLRSNLGEGIALQSVMEVRVLKAVPRPVSLFAPYSKKKKVS
jgi:hypothetical protein